MQRAINAIGRRFMSTESEWNPKVMLGRVLVAIMPENILHKVKKTYYAFLLRHSPEDWQEADAAVVRYLVSEGDCVIDIGASIGGYTKFLSALVGPPGCVYSFEPNPPIFDFLAHNVRKLKLSNVRLSDSALSDKTGTATIAIPRYRWGSECHYDATLESTRAQPGCRQVDVPVRTLDSFLGEHKEGIAFLKCDVNYHELACLRGGIEMIRRSRPAILIEILLNPDKVGGPAAAVFDLLRELGYEAYWLDGNVLRKRQPGQRSQNYFFLTRDQCQRLPSPLLASVPAPQSMTAGS